MASASMSEDEILQQVKEIIAKSLRIEPSAVKPDSYLDTDLNAASLDLVEMEMEVENRFNVWLPEKNILQTAEEVFGPGVLHRDGVLTPAGRQLLDRRLPVADRALLQGDVAISDLNRYFMKVSTWVHMIKGLLSHTPESCPSCGGAFNVSYGFRLNCSHCGQMITLRSGDDLNREWVRDFYENEYLPSIQTAHVSVGVGRE